MHSSKTYRHYLTRDLTAKYRTILHLNKEITQLKGGKRFEDTVDFCWKIYRMGLEWAHEFK